MEITGDGRRRGEGKGGDGRGGKKIHCSMKQFFLKKKKKNACGGMRNHLLEQRTLEKKSEGQGTLREWLLPGTKSQAPNEFSNRKFSLGLCDTNRLKLAEFAYWSVLWTDLSIFMSKKREKYNLDIMKNAKRCVYYIARPSSSDLYRSNSGGWGIGL